MGSTAASQLQASAAQAVADMSSGRTQHDESPYVRHTPNNRPRIGEEKDMHSAPTPPHAENRPVAV
jgi:hypothetical protein